MIFDHSQYTGGKALINWETINLNNNSMITLDHNLTLGGLGADKTATLTINASTLSANTVLNAVVQSNLSGNPALVNNAGTINIASQNATNSLVIQGNYVGMGGFLNLNAVLNGDDSSADKLVIDG